MNVQQLFHIGSYALFSAFLWCIPSAQAKEINLRNNTDTKLFAAIYYAAKHYGLRVSDAVKVACNKTTKIKLPALKGKTRRLLLLSKKSEILKSKMTTKEMLELPIKPLELPITKNSHILCSQEAKEAPITATAVACWPTLDQAA